MKQLLTIAAGLLLLCSIGRRAVSQVSTALLPAVRCDSAMRIGTRRQLPLRRRVQAWRDLRQCGSAGARIMANVIDDSHGMTDITALTLQSDAIAGWRDGSLFASAMSTVQDPSATDESRVFAVRYLLTVMAPELDVSFSQLTAGLDSTIESNGEMVYTVGCQPAFESDRLTVSSSPPPADYATQIHNLLAAIASDSSTPLRVRRAARCVDIVP